MENTVPLKALILVCSLTPSPAKSSSEHMAKQIAAEMDKYGVTSTLIRAVDHDIKPGVETDMGEGDAWPQIRRQMLEADILLIATPIWVGHPASVTQRIIERLDAELSETDDEGRLLTYGKVGAVAVVGNEDGAHHVSAELFQALSDVGFSIPAGGPAYWVGEAMQSTDYIELEETPEMVAKTIKTLAANSVHLARFLKNNNYPAV
ncbi:MAG: NADPH-dependent oxidoreductase [Candidatus Saccharibacteria bacterium]|nr:NADPH-dependent oxidoreductase [Candidatus Saccharibacteria bacterium]